MLKYLVHLFFVTYTVMLFTRLALSWFPSLSRYRFSHFLRFYTDPYLNIFRRFIPPIGGMFDVSPILSLFVLRLLESLVLKIL